MSKGSKLVKVEIIGAGLFVSGRATQVGDTVDVEKGVAADLVKNQLAKIVGDGDPVAVVKGGDDEDTGGDQAGSGDTGDTDAAGAAESGDQAGSGGDTGDGGSEAGSGDESGESDEIDKLVEAGDVDELKKIADAENVRLGNATSAAGIAKKIKTARGAE